MPQNRSASEFFSGWEKMSHDSMLFQRKWRWRFASLSLIGFSYAFILAPLAFLLSGKGHVQDASRPLYAVLGAPVLETAYLSLSTWVWLLFERLVWPECVRFSTYALASLTLILYGYLHVAHDSQDHHFHGWWIARFLQSGAFFALMALPLRNYVAETISAPPTPKLRVGAAAVGAFCCVALMHATHNLVLNFSRLWKLLTIFAGWHVGLV